MRSLVSKLYQYLFIDFWIFFKEISLNISIIFNQFLSVHAKCVLCLALFAFSQLTEWCRIQLAMEMEMEMELEMEMTTFGADLTLNTGYKWRHVHCTMYIVSCTLYGYGTCCWHNLSRAYTGKNIDPQSLIFVENSFQCYVQY